MGEAQGNDLQQLFDTRSGSVTQTHPSRLGIGCGQVRHLLDTGRWQRVLHGVYAVSTPGGAPPYRCRRALADAVALLADGVQSALEYRYAVDVEKAHGLPSALRQGPVTVDGRTLYEDCMYDSSGYALTVRLDGRRVHSMREVAFRDRRRDNAAALAGRARPVFGYEEVVRSPCEVAREVATVLTRLGWDRGRSACDACTRFW